MTRTGTNVPANGGCAGDSGFAGANVHAGSQHRTGGRPGRRGVDRSWTTAGRHGMGWASSPEEDRLLNEVLDEFMAQHPTIQVKFEPVPEYATKLQTDLAAGSAADVFYVDSLLAPDLMKRDLLMPLDQPIERDKVDVDDFYPPLLGAFQWQGKTYGLPKDWSSLALVWNIDRAREAGIDRPPSTWDELKSAAAGL